MAITATLLLIWLSLGVGIIGKDGDRANMMYFVVVALGLVGAAASRLQPIGMAITMVAMALVQACVAVIALALRLGLPWSPPAELLALNAFFIAMFSVSAWLLRRAAFAPTQAGRAIGEGRR